MSVTNSFHKAAYALGLLLAALAVGLHVFPLLVIGVVLLVAPGFLLVPKRVYVHLTTEDVVKLDVVVEEYMSGFASIEDVERILEQIMKAHGLSRH